MAVNFNINYDLIAPVNTLELSDAMSEGSDEDLCLLHDDVKNNQDDSKDQMSLFLGSVEYNERVFDLNDISEQEQHDDINNTVKQDVKFLKLSKKRMHSVSKTLQNKKILEASDKSTSSRIAKTRKYTKEMQNRDAIKKASHEMHEQSEKTVSILDDNFAVAARKPSRRFDNIVYNSATSKIAKHEVFDDFEDISDIDD